MTRVLVLYYSAWGHIESMAHAVAEGASQAGATVSIRRVPDLVPMQISENEGSPINQCAPLAHIDELADYDAIIIGTPTRFGSMAAPMRAFLERAGGLWSRNALVGKVGAIFTTSGTQHGGQETTILTAMPTLFHLGMIVIGLPYTFEGQAGLEEVKGGSPYGAGAIVGSDGERMPTVAELAGARFQGHHVATLASRLAHKLAA